MSKPGSTTSVIFSISFLSTDAMSCTNLRWNPAGILVARRLVLRKQMGMFALLGYSATSLHHQKLFRRRIFG
uniref:Putative secreted protein n=1 Tax=Ixodes ricinus TaxID=34613 RepID=A0A6B0U283_IXORI